MVEMKSPLPRRWLMSDERLDADGQGGVLAAVARLSPGDGVVLRHDRLPPDQRRALGEAIAALVAARGLVLAVKGDPALAATLKAAWVHNPPAPIDRPFSLAVHDEAEADRARTWGAGLVFVSPVHPTRSHPGAAALGKERARALANRCAVPAVALGGMDEERFAALGAPFIGWAGIGAFS